MRVTIKGPQQINGEIKAPGSKAYTHRALVASLLTTGETTIHGALDCDDTRRTLQGIKALGATVSIKDDRVISHGPEKPTQSQTSMNCGESGATLRFLTAAACSSPAVTILTAESRLAIRPLGPLLNALKELGAGAIVTQRVPQLELQVHGPLKGGETSLPGDISSQFVSGLLLAAPRAESDVGITVRGQIESRPYVDMTIEVLRRHGIKVDLRDNRINVPAPQQFKPTSHRIEGDYSSSAFLIAAAAATGESITITGLGRQSLEPDSVLLAIAPQLGLELHMKGDAMIVNRSTIRGFRFDARNNPDLVPALEVLGCAASSSCEIRGVRRLQYKESNRILTTPLELTKMGGKIHVREDRIRIEHTDRLTGASLDSHRDHRVAMACSIAALGAHGESMIDDADAVSKSYPDFFNDLTGLGATIHVE